MGQKSGPRTENSYPQNVYVSFDIDGLTPEYCPGTGTPVPGGLTFSQADWLLWRLACSGRRIVGFDLCEVAPGTDGEWDANTGARMLFKPKHRKSIRLDFLGFIDSIFMLFYRNQNVRFTLNE